LANYDMILRDGWKFHHGELDRVSEMPINLSHATSKAGGALKELDMFKEETVWQSVRVPHDWATELPLDKEAYAAGGFKERGTGWYFISFRLPEDEIGDASLIFDGVLGKCEVFVNGTVAGRNFSGYNRFSFDVGDYLLENEENSIAVYVDARRWEGWWYEGAGLYRNVYLQFRGKSHLDMEKCFVRSEKKDGRWMVEADLIGIGTDETMQYRLCLTDKKGNCIGTKTASAKGETIAMPVENPTLWSPETPELYTLTCTLEKDDEILDTFKAGVGFRLIEWKADEGMFLNGKRYPVKGICCHQDHAGVGAAVPDALMEYRISILKSLGINAYRCAHHAPTETLLEICDRQGMLVMVENRNFAVSEDVLRQLSSLVYVSRNHPSVFLYSLFNEEPWQREDRGRRIAEKMRAHILKLDDTRPITGAQNGGLLEKSNASDALDVIGANYHLAEYDSSHARTPNKVMIGTENCPTYATRGVHATDKDKQIFANYSEDWGDFSESLTETMHTAFYKPYVAGCFAWSGFDYRGEPTPYGWPSVLSHWGFTDYCGFPKDHAYLLASWYREELFVHLFPHWNHTPGEVVRVCAYTNAEKAELFVNDCSQGEIAVTDCRAEWRVPFTPGTIRVCAARNGQTARDEVKTAGAPACIRILNTTPDKADADAHIVNVCITDADGTVVPDCNKTVSFAVPAGTLLGVGNGDPNGHLNEKANSIPLFNGFAQLITTADAVTVSTEGLPDAHIRL